MDKKWMYFPIFCLGLSRSTSISRGKWVPPEPPTHPTGGCQARDEGELARHVTAAHHQLNHEERVGAQADLWEEEEEEEGLGRPRRCPSPKYKAPF
jgi:hypothetical protein